MAAKGEEDEDNIDFANYKGIYAEEESDTKYTCPVTGAHFEFNDVCKRLGKVLVGRKRMEEQEQLKLQQKQAAKQKEVFSSSTMSVSEEVAARNNFHANNQHHTQALYARQQQMQIQLQQQQTQQEQWARDQAALKQQHKDQHQQHQPVAAPHGQTQGTTNLKHKKAQSNQMQMASNQISTNQGHHVQGSSQTVTKSKASTKTAAQAGEAPHKFQMDAFVGSEGPVKYTNKTSQGNHRQSQQQHTQDANPNNMDSLEPDSVQQSTTKQLSRVNNQSISQVQQQQQQQKVQQQQPPIQHKAQAKGNYLQRNLTEVGPPGGQYNIKKNNFFTEPDEAMIQQSLLMQHNQLYGLQQPTDMDPNQQQQNQQPAPHAQYAQHSNGTMSIDQQQQVKQQQSQNGVSGNNSQAFNLVVTGNNDNTQLQHYSTNPGVKVKEGGKGSSAKSSGHPQAVSHHHVRTAASHFATQDNRQPHTGGFSNNNINQKSTGQLSAGMPQPYIATTSKTAQGKVRKSTSLKTGATNNASIEQEQLWQLNAQQQISLQANGQMQNQYQNVDQYNQLMAQLLKSQQKSASVVAAAANDKSNRTRTKSNATTSSMMGLSGKDKLVGNKQTLQKAQGGSQFIGNQQQVSAQQLQSQTFHATDSSQYYSNGLQGPHTKTQGHKPVASGSRNRDGSSVSIGNRKNSSSQQKAQLSNYIRQSQGGKQIKSSIASRNQQGIGGHLNSQVSKNLHRSVASNGQQFSTMSNYHSNKQHVGHKSSNLIQPSVNSQASASNPTHKIIDEVVLRLSQQQNQQHASSNNLSIMQPQVSGSRNKQNLVVSHTTGGPTNINKSSKQKSSGYFDQVAFQDIMQKYQRSNRQGPPSGHHQSTKYTGQSGISAHGGKNYASQGSASNIMTTSSAAQKNQLSAKKQARLSQYVHKEQKSRNPNSHGVGNSKTINDTLHQQSIMSQNQLSTDMPQKEVRTLKQGKISSQSRPLTSNYASHSGMASKSSAKHVSSSSNNNFQAQSHHTLAEMQYHSGNGHHNNHGYHNGQGLSVTGASKQKLGGGQGKPTIAINGTTKRKTASQSTLGDPQNLTSKGAKASRVQNQKVHLQQVQHPPQQAMYSQEINSASQEQMIMNYVNRMQHQQLTQHQQQQMMQQHTSQGLANQHSIDSIQQQQQQIQDQQQHHQQNQHINKKPGQHSTSSKSNQRTRTSGSHGMGNHTQM